jgi:hypothetical protein
MLNRLNGSSLTIAALAALAGCDETTSSQPTQITEEVALDFLIDQGELSILAVYPLEEWIGGASPGERTLRYELRRSGGEAIVSGSIPDPRVKPWEGGQTEPASAGVGSLRLPAEPGLLVILEGTHELGHADFDPARVAWQGIEDLEAVTADPRIALTADGPLRARGPGGTRPEPPVDIGQPERIFGKLSRAEAADILFVPEGFQKSKLAAFRGRATRIAREMLQQLSTQRNFRPKFNIWIQDVASKGTGIDDEKSGRRVDTAFGGIRYKNKGLNLTGAGWAKVNGLKRTVRAEVVIVIVNIPEGAGGTYANSIILSPIGVNQPAELVHEIGHALLKLADEYGGEGPCRTERSANVSFSAKRDQIPWRARLTPGVALPTRGANSSRRTVGAFEGAQTCDRGRFRSQLGCRMRSIDRGFCGVCLAAFERFFQTHRGGGVPGGSPCREDEFRDDGICDTCFPDDPDCSRAVCGDGVCDGNETDATCAADCGCAASDCDLAPFGCYCDPSCAETGDCCADAQDSCPAG